MQPDVFAPLRDSTAEINNITDLQQIKFFLALKLFNVCKSRRKLKILQLPSKKRPSECPFLWKIPALQELMIMHGGLKFVALLNRLIL